MKKSLLLSAALAALCTFGTGTANAADVTSWSDINTNRTAESILFQNDITAEGSTKTITMNTGDNLQVIDGGLYSLTGASGYKLRFQNTNIENGLTIQNFGKIIDGTEDSHTFSYTDTDGNTVYKTIQKSVSTFTDGAFTFSNPKKLTIKDTVFNDNTNKVLYIGLSGVTDTASIINTVFYGNKITTDDTAILTISKGTVNIDNLIFVSNDIGTWSQGLDFFAGTTTNISNSIFQNNKSGAYGTLQLSGGEVYIDNSQFINNYTKYYDGGAITVTSTMQNITNSVFKNNKAKGNGGAIWYAQLASSPYIVNTKFEENQSLNGVGGAIYMGGTAISTGTIYLINSEFKDNKSSYGGGIYTYDSTIFVVDTDFTGNTAQEGGAIYAANEDMTIFAQNKDAIFSGNIANNTTATYNGGAAIYYEDSDDNTDVAMNINAASDRKVIFDNTIAAYGTNVIMNVNKSGLSYDDINGNPVTITNEGEIQFNDIVGDKEGNIFNINLYGGMLSIGQNEDNNALTDNPDGFLNDNKFYVKGNSILNTVNYVIGEFAPQEFIIDDDITLDYMFDVDLANTKSDKIAITTNNGNLKLSSFNVISDTEEEELKVKYSDTNVNGEVKEGYSITTSTQTYDVTAENDDTGSYIVFKATEEGGGLPAAIINGSDQFVITDGQDENVPAWDAATGNVIKQDMDINGNGHAIYTENGIDGIVVDDGKNVTIRDVSHLSGFNNALTNGNGTLSIIDTDVTGNTGEADVKNNGGEVIIEAKTKDVNIGSGENTDSALYSDGGNVTVKGNKKVTFKGAVNGANGARMKISTDTDFEDKVAGMNVTQDSGTVDAGDVEGSVYTLNGGKLNLKKSKTFAPDTFKMNDGTVNIADEAGFAPQVNIFKGGNINAINGKTGNINFNDLTLKGAINLAVDVDMEKGVMDRISANSVRGKGMIKVNQFNILSETNKPRISIPFADGNLKNRVTTDVKKLEGEIYNYNISYDSKTGNFNIIGGGGNASGYSPSVMAASVATQLGGYLTQLNSYDEAFRNMDMYMLMTSAQRQALKNKNKYTSIQDGVLYDAELMRQESPEGWFRPSATFERVPLKNGTKVSNVMYSGFVGGESKMYDLGHGWDGIWGAYAGYNGSHQAYQGISIYQNGGTLGLVGMAYKGNFFTGLTVNTGANAGDAHTKFGSEDFAMLMAGVASKTGYNWELLNGKFIIQPSMLMSYSFVNTFDYRNAAGVKIDSDPLHAIHLQPELKFIGNLKNGWQPYASVAMIWNILDDTKFKANDISLPELSVKPYVKYGVGVRKAWGERFTGYFQTYLTNGGRNGVGLQAGFTWALGKNPKN